MGRARIPDVELLRGLGLAQYFDLVLSHDVTVDADPPGTMLGVVKRRPR
jgi:hypothetical protein